MNLHFVNIAKEQIDELQEISVSTFKQSFSAQNTKTDMDIYLSEHLNKEKLFEQLTNPESEFYFVKNESQTVGYFKVNTGQAQNEKRPSPSLEIERIYVMATYQGKGIGKKILEQTIDIAKSKNLKNIWLGVWEKNLKAISFYQKFGFKQFGSHPFMLGTDLQTDLLMEKHL